jgi:hypothetical protein
MGCDGYILILLCYVTQAECSLCCFSKVTGLLDITFLIFHSNENMDMDIYFLKLLDLYTNLDLQFCQD